MSSCQAKSSKKPWSSSEDATLLRLIEEYGSCGSWPKIALHMEWRTGKQCRERYINQLDPNIKKTPWSTEEDATILRLHDQIGNKWSKFMDYLPGRSDNAIKNRYHVICKDNCTAEPHSESLQHAYDNCRRRSNSAGSSHAVQSAKARGHKKSSVRVRTEESSSSESIRRMPSVEEETAAGLLDEFMDIENSGMDFDLGFFPELGTENMDEKSSKGSSSPSLSPRTTNDFNDSAGEEPGHGLSFSYSKSSTDGMSSRDSPVDSALALSESALTAAVFVSGPASSRNLTVAAALPVTPSDGSASAGGQPSPTAVHAGPSPTARDSKSGSKGGSPTHKANLNIETNNSLYDFDLCFPDKMVPCPNSSTAEMPPPHASILQSRSDDSVRVLQETLCWEYDPNVDLAQALEFLMSAQPSPAGTTTTVGPAFSSGSGSRPGSFRTAQLVQSKPRSPNSSLFNLLEPASPNTSQRLRPLSGNVASAASMIMRSNSTAACSSPGMARVNCDPELAPAAHGYHARPLPPHPPAPAAASPATASTIQAAPLARFSTGINSATVGMPEHSPMNHTHFSPACPNSKRPRGRNPCHFW